MEAIATRKNSEAYRKNGSIVKRHPCPRCHCDTLHVLNDAGDWCCSICGEVTEFLGLGEDVKSWG